MINPNLDFIKANSLEIITLEDGKEYVLSNETVDSKELLNFAHCNRLIPYILKKDTNISDNWKNTGFFTNLNFDPFSMVREYLNNYSIISSEQYQTRALSYINNIIKKGSSPIEIEKAISDTESIKKMFSSKKLGIEYDFILLMDNDCTQHFVIPNSSCRFSFKNISVAIALAEPDAQITQKAIDYILSGRKVPCVPGMLPEDVAKVADVDMSLIYNLKIYDKDNIEDEEDYYLIGPFVVISDDGYIGFAHRYSVDGKVWFWCGEHTNLYLTLMDRWQLEPNRLIYENSSESNVVYWHAVKWEYCDTDTFFRID